MWTYQGIRCWKIAQFSSKCLCIKAVTCHNLPNPPCHVNRVGTHCTTLSLVTFQAGILQIALDVGAYGVLILKNGPALTAADVKSKVTSERTMLFMVLVWI